MDCTCSSRTIDESGEVVHADHCPARAPDETWACPECDVIVCGGRDCEYPDGCAHGHFFVTGHRRALTPVR